MYLVAPARRRRAIAWIASLLACSALLGAFPCAAAGQASSAPVIPAGELVRLAVANEVAAAKNTSVKHMFRSRKQTPKGSQTRIYVETTSAMAAMLIAANDQPLPPQQQQKEMGHLDWLIGNPDQLRKKQEREKEDAERTLRIVKALPEAFLYEYAGTGNSAAELEKNGPSLVRLSFRPNPSYSPPSREELALEGMQGYLLIDAQAKRLARIDGTLFKDVSFGWGIIGHLDKGGHFVVQQADLGDGTWDITEMSLSITGRILLFKSLSMVWDEVLSDFRRVPDNLTFAQGVEMLKTEEAKQEHAAATTSQAKKTPQ
jgi:hypothetical protein